SSSPSTARPRRPSRTQPPTKRAGRPSASRAARTRRLEATRSQRWPASARSSRAALPPPGDRAARDDPSILPRRREVGLLRGRSGQEAPGGETDREEHQAGAAQERPRRGRKVQPRREPAMGQRQIRRVDQERQEQRQLVLHDDAQHRQPRSSLAKFTSIPAVAPQMKRPWYGST